MRIIFDITKALTTIIVVFFLSVNVNATHVSGGDITYRCLGNNQYEVTLSLYRDCSGAGLSNSATVRFQSDCGQNFTRSFNRISNTEISQLNPVCLSGFSTTCNGGNVPGMQAHVYRGVVTLPPCNSWRMSFGLCCRNSTTNVNGQPDYFVRSTLNSVTAPCNNSPTFNSPYAIPYMCIGQPVVYSYAVSETDGDSLTYELVSAESGFNNNVNYSGGANGTNPISGISIDQQTGLVQFLPTQQGFYIVVVQINEYDSNGNLKGTTRRDMQFVVRNCTNIVPNPAPTAGQATIITGAATAPDPYTIRVCENESFSFQTTFTDPDPGDSLSITSNIANVLNGATINSSGTNPLTVTVNWTPPVGSAGMNTAFSITVRDDACPISGIQTFIYNIDVIPTTSTINDSTICEGESIELTTTAGTNFNWTVVSGDPIVIGTNFSCNPCANPVATPSQTTTYRVVSNLSNGCDNVDEVTITVMPNVVSVSPIQNLCVDATPINLSFGSPAGGTYIGNGVSGGTFNPANATIGVHNLVYSYFDGICTFEDSIQVEVFPLPAAPVITPGGPFCCGDPAFNLNANVPNGTWSGVPIINTIDGTFNPSCANSGTHVIEYTVTDFNNCSNSSTETFVITNEIIPSLTAAPPTIPSGSSSSVSALVTGGTGLINFNWTPANLLTNPNQAWTNTNNLSASQLFTANGVDALGCTASANVGVIVTGGPLSVTLTATPNTVCPGDPVQLDALPSGGNGTYTYTWSSNPAGNAIPSIINPVVNPSSSTVYTVTVSSAGQTATATVTVNTSAGVIPTLGNFNNICVGSPAFTLTGGNPNGGVYSGPGVSGTLFNPSVAGVGTHTITYSYIALNGCIGQATSTIEVTPPPPATIAPLADVCVNDQPFLLSGGTPANGEFFGTGVNAFGVFNPQIAGVGTHTIFYRVDFGNNCIGTGSTTINVNGLPVINIDSIPSLCIDAPSISLSATPINGTFSGSGVTGITFDPLAAGDGTHLIYYEYTDANGCTNSDSSEAIVYPLPQTTFATIGNVCIQDDPFPITGAFPSGGEFFGPGVRDAFFFVPDSAGLGTHTITYRAYNDFGCFFDDTSIVTVTPPAIITLTPINDLCTNDSEFDLMPNASPQGGTFIGNGVDTNYFSPNLAGAGVHNIVYEFSDSLGCFSKDSMDITVFQSPTLTFSTTYTDTICVSNTVDFLVGGANTYDWTPTVGLDTNAGPNVIATPQITTTYTVTGTESGGCKTDTSFTVYVYDPLSVSTAPDTTICFGESISLDAQASGGNGNYTYVWSPVNNLSNPLIANPTANPNVSSTYTITLTDNCGSPAAVDIINISVDQLPIINYIIDPTEDCVPSIFNFSNSTANTQDCLWDFGNGVTESNCNFTEVFTTPGEIQGSLTVTDNNGCSDTRPFNIFARPNPIASFTFQPDVITMINPNVRFNSESSSNDVVEWYWNFDFIGEDTLQNPLYHFPDSGDFPTVLIVTNQFGCSDTTSQVVRIEPDHILFIPNAFTPTDDGLNDGFGPKGVGIRQRAGDYRMLIFNRWGEVVFESRNYEDLWLGTNSSGDFAPNGVYVYQIELIDAFNKRQQYSGKVTLIR